MSFRSSDYEKKLDPRVDVNPQRDNFEAILEEQLESNETVKVVRGMKSRHVQLIAIGGAIGTGLFVGSGSMLSTSGPASLLLAYIFMSMILWVVMNCLGEMTTYLPLPGVSAFGFVDRYVDTSLGFAAGYNYAYAFGMLIPSEITAAAFVVQYWTESVPVAAWITIFSVVIIALNLVAVKFYGEAEFWFASIKIICITGLIIVGIVIFFGGAPTHDRLGFRYWKHPGAFKEHIKTGDTGKFLGFWTCFIKSGFSFICSPELITAAAGETEAPRRNIPKATKRFVYRLIFFYVCSSLVIGCIVSSSDSRLMSAVQSGTSTAEASPFVIGIENASIPVLNHIINGAILTSAWSAGNSFLYASSRTVYSLALRGKAPKLFTICNKWGVPYYSVAVCSLFAALSYLNVSNSATTVFTWLSNISTISGFLSWICALIAYLRFRKAIQFNGLEDSVTFKTPLQPYATYVAIFVISLVTITNGYSCFFPGAFSASSFLAAYITLPIFLVLYIGHKIATKNWRWCKTVEEIDVISGKSICDAEEAATPERIPKNMLEKIWFWIA